MLRFNEPSGAFVVADLERSSADRSVLRPVVPQKTVEPAMLLRATSDQYPWYGHSADSTHGKAGWWRDP